MSATNRTLNRLLLGLFGVLLLAAGALTAASGAYPGVASGWTATGETLRKNLSAALAGARISGTDTSWWTIAALALAVVLMILLVAWIASQGGGRTNRAGQRNDPQQPGTTTVEVPLVSALVRDAVGADDRILSAAVTGWKIKGTDGLKIALQARKGVSPKDLTTAGEDLVRGLDNLLGVQGPVLIRISSGLRSTLSGTERVR